MKFIFFINIFDEKSNITMNNDYIIFRYINESNKEEISVNYSDIEYLHMSRYEDIYHLSIEDAHTVIEVNIDENDADNIEKCKTLYDKVLAVTRNCYSEDELKLEYKENPERKLMKFHVEKKRKNKYNKIKIAAVLVFILFIIFTLGIT